MPSQDVHDASKQEKAPINSDNDSAQHPAHIGGSSPFPSGSPSSPPNGGLLAWLQVASGFMIFFNTWGIITTFAVFQTYYESGALFKASSSNISWIGSIQSFLLQFTGIVAGPIYDRGYLRLLLFTGSFMVVFGLMMLSLSTEYWQALLSQAFCVGIGAGLLFVPTVSVIPTYFTTNIGLAIGVASSGSSIGGVIYPIVLNRLISEVGFPWAVRSIGFIALATFTVPLAALRIRVRVPKPRAIVDWAAFHDWPYVLFSLALLIVFIGNVVLIFYISFYPADRGFTDSSLAFYIVAIFNAGSSIGRILPNALSDRIGAINTIAPFTLLLGVTILCLLGVHNAAGIVVEAVVTGIFSGVVVALPPVCFRMLTENKSMIGTRTGQGFAIGGLGLLIGGPSGGAILGSVDPLNWTSLWVYGGVMACASEVILIGARIMRSGLVLKVKV